MKRTLLCIILTAALPLTLTGCFETGDSTSSSAVVESYVNEGNTEAAENYLMDKCRSNPSDHTYSDYLSFLAKNGKLDFLREKFPSNNELIFKGKPLSEYNTQEFLDMAGIETIGYRKETSLYQTEVYSGREEAGSMPLPFGIDPSMGCKEILEAAGFTEEQAELLDDISVIHIDCSGDSFVIDAKKTQYAPFSQHPEELWEFSIRYGSAELCFRSYGSNLYDYTLRVYF